MNRITTYQITTAPPLTQNPCYMNVCLAGQKKRWLAGSLAFVSAGLCALATKANVPANCLDKLNIEV